MICIKRVRGLKNLLSAKNIKTVGDLAAMSEPELETLPVPQPKSSRIRDALQYWMDHTNNKNKKTGKGFGFSLKHHQPNIKLKFACLYPQSRTVMRAMLKATPQPE